MEPGGLEPRVLGNRDKVRRALSRDGDDDPLGDFPAQDPRAPARGQRRSYAAPHPRGYARHWTPVHLDVVVDDIEAALARAVAAGARVELPIARYPYGKLAVLADPFGHGFCLLQLEGKGYDAVIAEP